MIAYAHLSYSFFPLGLLQVDETIQALGTLAAVQAAEPKESKTQPGTQSKGTKKRKGLMGLLCDPKDEAGREEGGRLWVFMRIHQMPLWDILQLLR